MDFQEKVRLLVGTQNKSDLSRKAGLPATAMDAVVNKGREPLASNAVRLARVLGVSCEWLFDSASGWPPPAEGVAEIGDAQIVDELTRRRRLVLRDIKKLMEQFRLPGILNRLESLGTRAWQGEFPRMTFQEQESFKAAISDLERLLFLSKRLQFLDPEQVHPLGEIPSVERLLADCPTVLRMLATNHPGNVEALLSHYAPGRLSPVAFGDGEIIDARQYLELGPILQRQFVPLIEDPQNGPPAEKPILISLGQPVPDRFKHFLRYRAESGQAFAYRVGEGNMAPGIPAGSIVVCQPGRPDKTGKHPCLVVFDHRRRQGLYLVDGRRLRSADPKKDRAIQIKPGDRPEFYPVIAGPFPGTSPSGADRQPK